MPRSKFLLALPALLLACVDHALVAPNPMPEQETDTYVPVGVNRKVDILFMIDNSLSMREEQENLARNFPAFIDELRKIEGGLPDVRIGVVTSDLGAGALASSGCQPGGQGGLFQGWDKGCGLAEGQRFITASDGERSRNYQGDLSAVFACMAKVGTSGCGFEHQLASASRALVANPGFLRDDAFLQIVLITDEDDCSAAADSDLFTRQFPDEEPSFRCARAGHLCQGRMPPAADFSAPLSECQPVKDGALTNVQTFVDQVRALKTDPSRILVSGIFGWPAGAGQYKVGRQLNDRGQLGGWDYLPACTSANGNATAALRVKQFVDAFGDNGAFESICADDFRPVLQKMGEKLRRIVGHDLCLEATVRTSGGQPDCLVGEVVPGAKEPTLFPNCAVAGNKPCWKAVASPSCSASGLELQIDRKGQPEPAEATVSIKCRTCVHPDDPRCQR
jgi:hypothetical protein